MSGDIIEILYERYNEFSNYKHTVKDPYTLFRIVKEGNFNKEVLEKKIIKYEYTDKIDKCSAFVMEKDFVQPKSIMLRFFYLQMIISALPDYFYLDINIARESILHISIAISMYYFGLQTYKFAPKSIAETEVKNIFGRDDFFIELFELQKVCGKITEQDYNNYFQLFAKNINDVTENDRVRLYYYEKLPFILCIEDFLDYIQYEIEKMYKEKCDDRAYSEYTRIKGYAFEKMVYGMLRGCFDEMYHTLFYYPNNKQKVEVDVVAKTNNDIVIFECKSGTLDTRYIDKEDVVKIKIKNKVKDAYKSLKMVSDYITNASEYVFSDMKHEIIGKSNNPICIHIAMYHFDFISSNIHAVYPEFNNKECPILTVSFEHLLAILLDVHKKEKNIFDYWKQRKEDIYRYPEKKFDNNELDLYYELINEDKNTMLAEIKKSGILDQISDQAQIVSTFKDKYGNETRPAHSMVKELESFLFVGILENGKRCFGINKRYLKNLQNFMLL